MDEDEVSNFRKVGIIGYGNLGKFLAKKIEQEGTKYGIELSFVWNRTSEKLSQDIPSSKILTNLNNFHHYSADLIVEVCHPDITKFYGQEILKHCDYMIGSPSALGDEETEENLRKNSKKYGVFIPTGALWGSLDIQRLAKRGLLRELKVTMSFHPSSLKLLEPLKTKNENVEDEPVVLYEGAVREICKFAPHNVNTMACASIAGLGLDKTIGKLISNPKIKNYHLIEIEVSGEKDEENNFLYVKTTRKSPSSHGSVTSSSTYVSFLNSLIAATHKGPGFHLC